MTQPKEHPEKLRFWVIALFFLGLFLMAMLAVGVGWAYADLGRIHLGWLNHALGSSLAVGGLALVIWSVRIQYTLGKGTPAPQVATLRLVIQGPYAYTRNPMTLGALLMFLGIGVWIGSGVDILLTLIVFSALLSYIYVNETRELDKRFGIEYLEYRKQTPFFLPRCRRLRRN